MFERFDDAARQAVVLSQEEARSLRHHYIGTEHLLLGLLREGEGVAARVLRSLGPTHGGVRAEIVRIVGEGSEAPQAQIPFTGRGKNVLELALREALARGHDHIGTEHLLLGLMREGHGVGARILLDAGVDAERVRGEIEALAPSAWPRDPLGHVPLRRTSDAFRPPLWIAVGLAVGLFVAWLIWGA